MVLLLGRDEERTAVAEAVRVPGRPLVVRGEAGVGKTTLVRAALAEDHDVAEGGALASLSWSPHLPLRRALPGIATWEGDAEHVAALVRDALGERVLLVDDVQWADHDTLGVLEQLAPTVRVVLTLRREDPAAAAVAGRLDDVGAAVLDLEPLPDAAAEELARRLSPGLAGPRLRRLVARSGGNPLLVEELARSDGEVDTVALALGRRVQSLPEEARAGLLLLAAADVPLPRPGVPGTAALEASGLVVAQASGPAAGDGAVEGVAEDVLVVRHRLVAELVLDLAEPEERRRTHDELADRLSVPGERVRHLIAAGRRPEAHRAALAALDLARTPGERYAHLIAAAQCAPVGDDAGLLVEASRAANDAALPIEAAAALDRIPDLLATRPDVLLERGRALFELGDVDGWQKTVIQGAALASDPESRAYFAAEEAAVAYFVEGDPARAAQIAAPAVVVAEAAGVRRAPLVSILSSAHYLLGDPAWTTTMEQALELARAEDRVGGTFVALNNLVEGHESAGDPALAAALADDAVAEAEALHLTRWARHFRTRRLSLAVHAGDHDVADELGRSLLEEGLMPRSREEVATALAASLADRGRVPEALALSETHLRAAPVRPGDYHLVRATAFWAEQRWAAVLGERETYLALEKVPSTASLMAPVFGWAALLASRPLPVLDAPPLDWGMLAGVPPELAALAALAAADPAAAVPLLERAAAAYAGYHRRGELRCRWGRGRALLVAGEREEGLAALRAVEDDARRAGFVPLAALAVHDLRDAGGRAGRRTTAARTKGALTTREAQVVDLVAEGLADAEIARRLGRSPRTVQTQLASARRKLGATSRHHAAELWAGGRDVG